jgi:hypothetical protein
MYSFLVCLIALAPSPGDLPVSTNQPSFELVGPRGERLLGGDDLVGYEWAAHALILRPGGVERLRIALGYPTPAFFVGADPRGDERVRRALEALGKLR